MFWTPSRIGLLLLAALSLAACRKEGIRLSEFQARTLPVDAEVLGLFFADSLHGYAVGGRPWESGFIVSTADGGATWRLDTLLSNRMEAVSMSDDGQAFACGMDGRCLHRPPGSEHWVVFRMDYAWMRDARFVNSRYGIAVAGEGYASGRVYRYGPEHFWELDTVQDFPNELAAVCFSDSLTAHAAGYGWVMRSDDAGRSWKRSPAEGDFFQDIHFPSPETGYICGASGTLLKTTDGGRHWQKIRSGAPAGRRYAPFRALWFVAPDTGYVAGDDGLLWRSHDGGASWQVVEGTPPAVDFTDVQVVGGQGWLSAKNGRMYRFTE